MGLDMNARRAGCIFLVVASTLVASERDAAAAEAVGLTVPYVKQTKALCGGAAAAMVFRYWGDGQADQKQFAPLLDSTASGIATDVLAQAIEDRGWRVVRFVGSVESIHDLLRDRRPVIVLLGESRGRFHYVVVVGTTGPHRRSRSVTRAVASAECAGLCRSMAAGRVLGAAGAASAS